MSLSQDLQLFMHTGLCSFNKDLTKCPRHLDMEHICTLKVIKWRLLGQFKWPATNLPPLHASLWLLLLLLCVSQSVTISRRGTIYSDACSW